MLELDDLVAAHAADAPDSLIKSALYPSIYYDYANIRGLAEAAKRDHLSFFATSEASGLARMKLPRLSIRYLKRVLRCRLTAPLSEGQWI